MARRGAEFDDVGAVGVQTPGMADCLGRGEVASTVREGVLGDVHDPDDPRPFGPKEVRVRRAGPFLHQPARDVVLTAARISACWCASTIGLPVTSGSPQTTLTSRPSLTSASSIIASEDQLPTFTV